MMMNLPCLWGSCPNFLRPIHSYTECQPSCLTGSVPHGNDRCRLQLLFFHLIATDHAFPYPGTDLLQWTLYLDKPVLASLLMQLSFKLHHLRVSFPEPCPGPKPAGASARLWNCYVFLLFCTYTAACPFVSAGYLMSLSILSGSYLVPVLRIVYITLSSLHAITISDCIFLSGLFTRVV